MGLLIDGLWHDKWYQTKKGEFVRESAQFRHQIEANPNAKFTAEQNRYHLYVSLACPWAHRTLIFRTLKKLEAFIDVSVVHPDMLSNGWEFKKDMGATGDPLYDFEFLHQIYTKAQPDYTGRVTVPVLWDKKHQTIVNNESAEIIRMFNHAFDHLTGDTQDFTPQALQPQIDELNELIYQNVNNGVYRAGFATTQEAYEEAFTSLFDTLDQLEARLEKQTYLIDDELTEADWRFFTTLIRFDAVYVGHFKCNKKRIADYPNLSRYLKRLYTLPGIAETVNLNHIKRHYYYSHTTINPTQIVPLGPEQSW